MSMTDDAPTADPRWQELLEDAHEIAGEYRIGGWDAVVVEPHAVFPSERDERFGLAVHVSATEYELLETLVANDDVTFDEAEVYYRAADAEGEHADRRFALVVERDMDTEQAVCVPLTYSLSAAQSVFETALLEEELLVHVSARRSDAVDSDAGSDVDAGPAADDTNDAADEQWVTFSHDDPSLFLEESDVRAWSGDSRGEA